MPSKAVEVKFSDGQIAEVHRKYAEALETSKSVRLDLLETIANLIRKNARAEKIIYGLAESFVSRASEQSQRFLETMDKAVKFLDDADWNCRACGWYGDFGDATFKWAKVGDAGPELDVFEEYAHCPDCGSQL